MPEEQAPLIIACACGQKMKAPAGAVGKTYRCVKCGERISVTQDMAQPVKAEAAAPPPENVPPPRELMGQLLLDAGIVTAEQLQEALEAQKSGGGKLFEVLIRLGHLKKDVLHDFLSRQPGVAAIDLRRVQIDRKLIETIPRELALECLLLPIDRLGKLLTVAMACPLDKDSIEKMEQLTGLKVKAMLCRLDDIHVAVQKYYPSDPLVSIRNATFGEGSPLAASPKKDVGELLARLNTLLPSREALNRVRAVCGVPDGNIQDLVAVGGEDPVIAALILRAANSAAYGLQGSVDSVALAVVLLGHQGVLAAMPPDHAAEGLPDFARRSVRAANLAAALAQASNQVGASVAYTAGLLHLLGGYALASAAPDRYAQLDRSLDAVELGRVESRELGMSHDEASFSLATRWRFPDALCKVLRHYSNPKEAGETVYLATLVAVSAFVASKTSKIDADSLEPCRGFLKTLGMDPATVVRLSQNLDGA